MRGAGRGAQGSSAHSLAVTLLMLKDVGAEEVGGSLVGQWNKLPGWTCEWGPEGRLGTTLLVAVLSHPVGRAFSLDQIPAVSKQLAMGNLFTNLFKGLFGKKEMRILMGGFIFQRGCDSSIWSSISILERIVSSVHKPRVGHNWVMECGARRSRSTETGRGKGGWLENIRSPEP